MRSLSFFLFATILFFGLHYSGVVHFDFLDSVPEDASYAKGKAIPDVVFTKLDGTQFRLSEHAGKVVLLHFWGTWCAPCQEEFPRLIKEMKQYEQQNMVMLAVAADHTQKEVKDFFEVLYKEHELSLPRNIELIWDEDGKVAAESFQITGFPETIVLNSQHLMLQKIVGPIEWDKPFLELLAELLNETQKK